MAPMAVKTTPASYQVLAGQCARKHVLLRCDQNVLPDRPSMRSEKERSSPVGSAGAGAGAGGGVGERCVGGGSHGREARGAAKFHRVEKRRRASCSMAKVCLQKEEGAAPGTTPHAHHLPDTSFTSSTL
jgi:hypothetical protein